LVKFDEKARNIGSFGQTAELKHRMKINITDTSYAAVEKITENVYADNDIRRIDFFISLSEIW